MVDFSSKLKSRPKLGLVPKVIVPRPVLNLEQQAAIDFMVSGSGNLNLVARAGTGKTTTLLEGLRYLEGDIVFCAFGHDIAEEIKGRVALMGVLRGNVRVSTVHSLGMSTLMRAFTSRPVVDKGKMRKLVDHLSRKSKVFFQYGGALIRLCSFAKQQGFGVKSIGIDLLDNDQWDHLREWFNVGATLTGGMQWEVLYEYARELYDQSLRACRDVIPPFSHNVVDFDDMLLAPLWFGCRFWPQDHILLDEAQDSNSVRREIVYRMTKPRIGRVYAVGDPNQAIYAFTGADSRAMDILSDRLKSKTLKLTITYRNTQSIVAMAQQWVPDIQPRPDAPVGVLPREVGIQEGQDLDLFWDEAFRPLDIVLCRNTRPLVQLAYDFLRRDQVPIKILGKEEGDRLAALVTSFKVTDLNQLDTLAREWGDAQFKHWTAHHREMKAAQCRDDALAIVTLIRIAEHLGRRSRGVTAVLDIIADLFIDFRPGEQRCLTFATVHKAKGREWDRVYILGRAAYMPSKQAHLPHELEQEINLMYVAVTRAKSELIDIVVPVEKRKRRKEGDYEPRD